MKKTSFVGQDKPLLCAMVQENTKTEAICMICNAISEGAEAIGIQLECLERQYLTEEDFKEIFSYCKGLPIYATAYRKDDLTDEKCAQILMSAAEKVLKILSVTGEYADRKKKQVKASVWSNLKRASKKAPKTEDFIFEKKIAEQKLEKLKKSLVSGEGLVAGIRPERFKIEKCDASADMSVQGGFIVQPTVCELLGGEYNVHFDYCGKDMVGQMDAKTKISTKDTIFVRFSAEDIYLFDPITGDIIQ